MFATCHVTGISATPLAGKIREGEEALSPFVIVEMFSAQRKDDSCAVLKPCAAGTGGRVRPPGLDQANGSGRGRADPSRKSARIHRLPAPVVSAHLLDAKLRAPSQQPVGRGRVSKTLRNVARPARDDLIGHRLPRRLLKRAHHVEHAVSLTRTEIHNEARIVLNQRIQRRKMPTRKIDHMNVIAHAGAIGRVVITAEDAQLLQLANCNPATCATNGIRLLGTPAGSSPINPLSCAPTGLK
ncbi:hypothetical protein P3T21_007102 [Paraburkholderia sp. GAS334]